MNIRKMYEYTYYKFYKLVCIDNSQRAYWKTSSLLFLFFVIFLIILNLYSEIFMEKSIFSATYEYLILMGIFYVVDHYTFHSKNQWKEIVKRYDAWPRKKNLIGGLIVWGIVLIVIAIFILALVLRGKVN